MLRIVPSPAARGDLLNIRAYSIDQFSAEIADVYFLGFDEAFNLLALHPMAGPERSDISKGLRCLVHSKHRIFYRVKKDMVVIVRVVHHSMDDRQVLRG